MTFSPESSFAAPILSVSPSVWPSEGEIGIVSRGTGFVGSMPGGGEARVAIVFGFLKVYL